MTDDAIIFAPDPLLAKAFYFPRPPRARRRRTAGPCWPGGRTSPVSRAPATWPSPPARRRSTASGACSTSPSGPASRTARAGSGSTTAASTPMARHAPRTGRRAPDPAARATPSRSRPPPPWIRSRPANSPWPPGPRPTPRRPTRPVLTIDARVQGSTRRARDQRDRRGQGTRHPRQDHRLQPAGRRRIKKAGDLVWTYGSAHWDQGRGHHYHVWQRRGGKWSLVFDQIIAVQKP